MTRESQAIFIASSIFIASAILWQGASPLQGKLKDKGGAGSNEIR
jgi:hypothetical protein